MARKTEEPAPFFPMRQPFIESLDKFVESLDKFVWAAVNLCAAAESAMELSTQPAVKKILAEKIAEFRKRSMGEG